MLAFMIFSHQGIANRRHHRPIKHIAGFANEERQMAFGEMIIEALFRNVESNKPLHLYLLSREILKMSVSRRALISKLLGNFDK